MPNRNVKDIRGKPELDYVSRPAMVGTAWNESSLSFGMNLFVTADRANYRRWVNLVPSVILPGASQFLSGRCRAALAWFLAYVVYTGLKFFLIASPYRQLPTLNASTRLICDCGFLVAVWIDACRRPMPRIGFKGWLGLLGTAAAVTVLPLLVVRQFLLRPFYLPTHGMQPTLLGATIFADGRTNRGDCIMVDELTYHFRKPRRGELVVFWTDGLQFPGLSHHEIYIKRLAGLPGEHISIRPPFLCVNGSNVVHPPIFAQIASGTAGYSGFSSAAQLASNTAELALGKGEYFVLGDNTTNSLDSRYFGPVPARNIMGRAAWIYSPRERRRCIAY